MATLYGATLVLTTAGALTDPSDVTIGGLTMEIISDKFADDVDFVPTKIPGGIDEGPIRATAKYKKTTYDAYRDKLLARTMDVLTYTDKEGNKWEGNCFVTSVTNTRFTLTGEAVFDVEITPETKWAYTPSA